MMRRNRWWAHKFFARIGNTPQMLGISYGVSIAAGDATKTGDVLTDVIYTITVTNDGSAPDIFDIAKSGEVWTTVLSDASIGPIAGEGGTDTFTVTVSVPINVADEATDGVTITVTSQASAITSDTEALTTTANQLYQIYDTFTKTNPEDAGEVGTGWNKVDTGGKLSIVGNALAIATSGAYNDPELVSKDAITRAAGVALEFTLTAGQSNTQGLVVGLFSSPDTNPVSGDKEGIFWFFSGNNFYCREAAEPAAGTYDTSPHTYKMVLKTTGATYYQDDIEVADLAVASGSPLYVGITALNGTWVIDNVKVY